jgi:hypothetical protein
MRPYLDTCFRLRWLWPLAGGLWLAVMLAIVSSYRAEYEGVVRIWTRPSLARQLMAETDAQAAPPNQTSVVLKDLFASEGFLLRAIEQTPLRDLTATDEGRVRVLYYVMERLTVAPTSASVVELRFVSERRDIIAPVLSAVAGGASDAVVLTERAQADVALQYFEPQQRTAEAAWLTAAGAVHAQLAANADLTESEVIVSTKLLELRQREESARRTYDRLTATLEQLRLASDIRATSLGYTVKIIDGPIVPAQPRPIWQALGWRLGAATTLMLAAALGVALLATWTDATLRRAADAPARLATPVLGALPRRRRAWLRRSVSTRRAMLPNRPT